MGYLLGVDGGGTKTEFVLVDAEGRVRATHQGGSCYYIQIGFDGLHELLSEGVQAVLAQVSGTPEDIDYAFFGLPAYGEDSIAESMLDVVPEAVLGHHRYLCGNDMICGWAGSLAGADGINIVAGTGSIGYGEHAGKSARGGGWGEVFSDEGSAYWIAISGLNAFSRMADGRLAKGPLYEIFRQAFDLKSDLDICGDVFGRQAPSRDKIAAMSKLVSQSAEAGDRVALKIFDSAGYELAAIVDAIRAKLDYALDEPVALSYSGGVFKCGALILDPFSKHLNQFSMMYDLRKPLHAPSIGSALYAARRLGRPFSADVLASLPRL
jgi:N-acetylglucosamine kinase-like BadF-type ATPase